ncbi:MAG: MerR family transcriptional regulator [Anaerolineales bacterium]|nr:MerR family transcriptional regulator [Anaerolineales bacterium]
MKISEISEKCEVSADTLRYYERIGLLPPVNRNKGGIRDYSDLDIRRVKFIKCMRTAGLPVEVLIKYYRLVQQGDDTMEARKAILVEQRAKILARMEELQKTLDLLNYKISYYESSVLKAENAMVVLED